MAKTFDVDGTFDIDASGDITITSAGSISLAPTTPMVWTGDLTINGDFVVNGTAATLTTTNTTISDTVIELGNGTAGAPVNDAGIVMERGSSDNVFMGWDESGDYFTVGTGSFTGASTGNLTYTEADFHAATIVASTGFTGDLTGNADTATTAAAWTTTRTITMTGDVSADAVNIDGSGNIDITNTVVANDSHTHDMANLTGTTYTAGIGSALTAITAANISAGSLAVSVLPYVTASSSVSALKVLFANTASDASGNFAPLIDDTAGDFTYQPSTGTLGVDILTATTVNGTLGTAAQGNVTSLGTLTTLDVDNININTNTISSTDGNGNIVLDPNGTGYVTITGTNAFVPPVGSGAQRPGTPVDGMLRFNNSISKLEFYNGATWEAAGITVTGQIISDEFNATGGTAAYTLSQVSDNEDELFVTINGVVQTPVTAYTVSGTTITFTSTPVLNDTIVVRNLYAAQSIVQMADADFDTYINVEESPDKDEMGFFAIDVEAARIYSDASTEIHNVRNAVVGAVDKVLATTANVVDVLVYDTSGDSDAGDWRYETENTSWFEETLSTATRGETARFPKVALIVAETDTLTIYDALDLDASGIPEMWMVFNAAVSNMAYYATISSITALNGAIVVGSASDVIVVDFIKDDSIARITGNAYRYKGGIEQRNDTLTYANIAGPGLVNGVVNDVAITVLSGAPIDSDTGLPTPTIAVATDGGVSVINNDGTVADSLQTNAGDRLGFVGEVLWYTEGTGRLKHSFAAGYASDGFGHGNGSSQYTSSTTPAFLLNGAGNDFAQPTEMGSGQLAIRTDNGLTYMDPDVADGASANSFVAYITKDYNTGWMPSDIRGAWLANSPTVDRSVNANTLTENGTVTSSVASTGTELLGYSGITTANYFSIASNADWDVIGTGALTQSIWFKSAGNSADEIYLSFENAGATVRYMVQMQTDGTIRGIDDGATAQVLVDSTATYDDGIWHKIDFVRESSTSRHLYIDGISVGTSASDAGSISDSGNLPLAIGRDANTASKAATTSTLTLARMTAYAPTAAQVKKMYNDEKVMFVDNADCLLGGTTNVVNAVDYDNKTKKTFVGTTDGTSVMHGFKRTSYIDLAGTPTNDTVNSVSAHRNVYLIGTGAEAVVYEPELNLKETNNGY